jgi:hypothetical protein
MRRFLVSLLTASLLSCGALATGAGADPTQHFTVTFTIVCGGNDLVIVAKPGSSNVVTVNGLASTSVSVLFGLHVVDNLGNVVVDFSKPGHQPVQTCRDTSWPTGWTATAETLITPAH